MSNEIEKTFFDTFGIRAYYKYLLIDETSRYHNEKLFDKTNFIDFVKSGKDYLLLKVIKYYPQITDRILLELICILNKHYSEHYQIASMIVGKNIEEVKKSILNDCIEQSKHKDFKQQIQALFKEDN